jgi:hypothetical protein
MKNIKLLNGDEFKVSEIIPKMYDDSFYYGYLGQHALSSSSCKKLIESPKAYATSLTEGSPDSQALRDGRLTHLCVLEPHRLKEFTFVDGTKASKSFKLTAEELGKDLVYTNLELNKAQKIAKAVLANEEAAALLSGCEFEIPAIGEFMGLPFRGKADAKKGTTIIDLKTTANIQDFEYSAKKYSYDLQAALYLDLFNADDFIFLVVDKRTLDVGVYTITAGFIDSGLQKLQEATDAYKNYIMSDYDLEQYTFYGEL